MCLLTIAAYWPSLSGSFVYEDDVLPELTAIARGLSRWSHEVTRWIAGAEPFPARVVNLVWHLLNGALLWVCARHVLTTTGALFAVALFLLHPVQVESVAYVASRPELVAGMWVLLALWASACRRVWLAALCACLAVTGKEVAVVAVWLVPIWMAYLRRWTAFEREVWCLGAAVITAVFVIALNQRDLAVLMPWSFYGASLAEAARLLWLLPEALWNPSALTIDHDPAWITQTVAVVALVLTPWLMVVAHRASRLWALAAVWTLVALAPRLVVPLADGIHERHLYIPMVAICLALGGAVFPQKESV